MAVGFLHDIAHGPFSHAIDFIIRQMSGKKHEAATEEMIRDTLPSQKEDSRRAVSGTAGSISGGRIDTTNAGRCVSTSSRTP
jgi:HD superfamily phosphohydrolase